MARVMRRVLYVTAAVLLVGAIAASVFATWTRPPFLLRFGAEPTARTRLPTGRGFVIAFDGSSSRAFVDEVAGRPGTTRWSGLDGDFASRAGAISGAWWMPSLGRLYVLAGSDPTLFSVDRDGHAVRVIGLVSRELTAGRVDRGCAPTGDGSALWCWGYDAEGTHRFLRTVPLVPGGDARTIAWSTPVGEAGVMAPGRDAHTVYFADRCEAASYGTHCVFRATPEGADRALVASLPGNACVIAPSPDGRSLAIASRTDSYTDPCTELFVRPATDPSAPGVHTQIARPPGSIGHANGISALAWSPDNTRLAVVSDHEMGCAGSEGVTVCSSLEYVVDAARPGFHAIGFYAHEGGPVVWLPP